MLNKRLRTRGFALAVIAVTLLITGLLLLTMFAPEPTQTLERQVKTQKKLDAIKAAILIYYQLNGTLYPCPAQLTVATDAAGFGSQINANCQTGVACAGVGIICPTATTWIGGVPVRTIGLPDNYAFDDWGNRFTYIVNNNGTFTIKNLSGTVLGTTNYYVLSHGKDGIGAYNRAGARNSCTLSGATVTTSELENCNDDTVFIYSLWNQSATTYFDDMGFKF